MYSRNSGIKTHNSQCQLPHLTPLLLVPGGCSRVVLQLILLPKAAAFLAAAAAAAAGVQPCCMLQESGTGHKWLKFSTLTTQAAP
jgi:hypothetical protein